MNIPQRIREWLHERYIRRLQNLCLAALRRPDRVMARVYWGLFVGAINARSASQVCRMERRIRELK
jgi:hypothetical protein